jgi:AraC-like DNA-binding protein/quercetin dioxygenase-like cupin family protein
MMSQKRQMKALHYPGNSKSDIATLTRDYSPGHTIPPHFHNRDQLVYASRGVMTVRTRDGTWVVPPYRAVWIPASISHTITMSGAVAMRTLYLKARTAKTLPRECRVVNVSPLLKELVLYACALGTLKKTKKRQQPLIAVIIGQLEVVEMVGLQLPHLSDPRAARVAGLLIADPSDRRSLAQISKLSGASKRTVERLFHEETGMTFGKWRQQLRLMQAMRQLAEGAKVTHAALDAGYSTPSAFIAMFRKVLGTTPTSYFKLPGKTIN